MAFTLGEHRGLATEFKKGMIPKNKLPVGSVTIRTHSRDKPRAWIKVAEPNVWILRAQYIWLTNGGVIPGGFVIHHQNQDPMDDAMGNLKLVSRGAHLVAHRAQIEPLRRIGNARRPLKPVVCTRCGTKYKAKKRARQNGAAYCLSCKKEAARESKCRYKQRIHAARG